MSIIIKGLEMPESCIECPCLRHDSIDGKNAYQCNVTLEKFDIHGLPCSERDEKCPLDHFREVTKNDVPDANVGNSSEIPNSSDLIFRKAAIDALDCISGTEEVLRSLPSAQPEQRWIPCSERLPEAKQRVLVTFPDGTVDIKICIDAGHLKWFYSHMAAWMPLPEPNMRGEQDETN